MEKIKPTKKQVQLIKSRKGIYLIDAGPGTGKTFTITQRYVDLLKEPEIEPKNILLITFTNNAAEQMKKKVLIYSDYNPAKLHEAPISTFHSHCKKILDLYGFEATKLMGINDNITPSIKIIDNEPMEKQHFRRYFYQFMRKYPEYENLYKIIAYSGDLLDLIKSLSAKGIFPTKNGWLQNGKEYLEGNFKVFKELFDKENAPKGNKQSKLRAKLSSYNSNKCYLKDAPNKENLLGTSGVKQIDENYARKAFNEDRKELINFVHDIYFNYIKYALRRNYVNFSFLIMFTYFLLCQDHELREDLQFDYIMVDEFQDTNEIQFKLIMLLSKNGNIFVVGDWKQSIYSFQYATVENIRNFEDRLKKYRDELNKDYNRIKYQVNKIQHEKLEDNYRSTQKIIDFSEQSLLLEATQDEILDKNKIKEEITSLAAVRKTVDSKIEAFTSNKEKEAILAKIIEIIKKPEEYMIEDKNYTLRQPSYGDIAILTRTSKFGLKLQNTAQKYGIPVSYEAGIELFKTDPAIILLAWLRILNNPHSLKGWAVILEEAGYYMDEIKYILKTKSYPENMYNFRKILENYTVIRTIARKVFELYNINNGYADKIIEVLQRAFDNSFMNTGKLIHFIEDNIEAGITYEIDSSTEENVVKIQTIHAAKGLEYPIVFISDINFAHFPSLRSDIKSIIYNDTIGLRQKKIFSKNPYPFVYDNWKIEILTKSISKDYDEERRLLYVAMTRTRDHLFLTSQTDKSSLFFRGLREIEPFKIEGKLKPVKIPPEEKREILEIEEPHEKAPIKLSVHAIMEEVRGTEGKGEEYGIKVHLFAERYVKGEDVEPKNEDEKNVKKFINRLEGALLAEQSCLLPIKIDGIKNRKIILSGIIDLINIVDDKIQIIDYKTDRNKKAENEYRKQLSVYYHVLKEKYDKYEITAKIFYTYKGKLRVIKPLSIKELERIVSNKL